jgi:hypothetical protein
MAANALKSERSMFDVAISQRKKTRPKWLGQFARHVAMVNDLSKGQCAVSDPRATVNHTHFPVDQWRPSCGFGVET